MRSSLAEKSIVSYAPNIANDTRTSTHMLLVVFLIKKKTACHKSLSYFCALQIKGACRKCTLSHDKITTRSSSHGNEHY